METENKTTQNLPNSPENDEIKIEPHPLSKLPYANYMKQITTKVHKNIFALQKLTKEMQTKEFEMKQQIGTELNKNIIEKERPFLEEAICYINGTKQATDQPELEEVKEMKIQANRNAKYKGIPTFWSRVFFLKELLMGDEEETDEEILKTLMDVKINEIREKNMKKRTIEFVFDENKYMKAQSICVSLSYEDKVNQDEIEYKIQIEKEFEWKGKNPYDQMLKENGDNSFFLIFLDPSQIDLNEDVEWFNTIYDLKAFLFSTIEGFKSDLPEDEEDGDSMEIEYEDDYYKNQKGYDRKNERRDDRYDRYDRYERKEERRDNRYDRYDRGYDRYNDRRDERRDNHGKYDRYDRYNDRGRDNRDYRDNRDRRDNRDNRGRYDYEDRKRSRYDDDGYDSKRSYNNSRYKK